MIQFIAEGIKFPDIEKLKIKRWINSVANEYGKKIGEIAFIFCADEKILEINKQYLNHDYYTDIITFDYSEVSFISGDIFISVDTVMSNSIDFKVNFEDELLRIIIHGILHLCGQDDKTTELRAQMTDKENLALKKYNK